MKRTIDFVINEQEELQLMLLARLTDRPPSFLFDSVDYFLEQYLFSASLDPELGRHLSALNERIQSEHPPEKSDYFSDYEYSYAKSKHQDLEKESFAHFLSDLFNKRVYLRLRKTEEDAPQNNVLLDMLYEEEFKPVKDWLNEEILSLKVRRSDASRFSKTRDLTYQGWANIYKEQIEDLRESYSRIFLQQLPLENFLLFFGKNRDPKRICSYCRLNEQLILDLKKSGEIYTKESFAKVSKLNVKVRDSLKECTLDNLVIFCHWCERLNLDEFSEGEFQEIAVVLTKIWENRLNKHPY